MPGARGIPSAYRPWKSDFDREEPLILTAPAKINLSLRVIGRREDGYHELSTRMQKLEFGDTIEVVMSRTPGITCRCNDPDVPVDQGNLAVRAALSFLRAAGQSGRCGVSLVLTKRIPVAAGLGGGSSDAGAVLLGLNSFLSDPFSADELQAIALQLGADVPFFVQGAAAALATGVGEILDEVKSLQGYHVLLVNPGFSVSTRDVFENYALTTIHKNSTVPGFCIDQGGHFQLDMLFNDLEQVTMTRFPVVASIKKALLAEHAAGSLMTGSGPTVFALFSEKLHTKESLIKVAERIAAEFPGRVFITRAVPGA